MLKETETDPSTGNDPTTVFPSPTLNHVSFQSYPVPSPLVSLTAVTRDFDVPMKWTPVYVSVLRLTPSLYLEGVSPHHL